MLDTESGLNILDQCITDQYAIYNGDCVEGLRNLPDNSIDFSVFSPPFSSLYTYSNSDRDMGNSKTYEEFAQHYSFLAKELFRVMKPGRLVSIHCMNLPTSKERHGYIGIQDFRGDLIRLHQGDGFIYHSEVCIWKDPVTAMQRTKALGLLHKQLEKDSCMSRQGIPDYLVTFRKPGVNENRVTGGLTEYHGEDEFSFSGKYSDDAFGSRGMTPEKRKSIEIWQRYASPVWMDINPSDTLQRESAREEKDERHICPLQLGVIRRALQLWSNPDDVVLSPFAGIGSELYVAVQMGRRGVGFELKQSYYRQAVLNLRNAVAQSGQKTIFDYIEEDALPESEYTELEVAEEREAVLI